MLFRSEAVERVEDRLHAPDVSRRAEIRGPVLRDHARGEVVPEWQKLRGREQRLLAPANAERGERRTELGLLVAGERDQVAIVERLAPDDPGKPGGRRATAVVAGLRIDQRDELADLVEDLGRDGLRREPGPAAARSVRRETARAPAQLAEWVSTVGAHTGRCRAMIARAQLHRGAVTSQGAA